jgi:hypothetical protein
MKIDPAQQDSIPKFTNAAVKYVEWLESKGVARLWQRMSASIINFNVNIVRIIVHSFRYYILGQKGLYKVVGPGDLYVMTRLKPVFKLPTFQRNSSMH